MLLAARILVATFTALDDEVARRCCSVAVLSVMVLETPFTTPALEWIRASRAVRPSFPCASGSDSILVCAGLAAVFDVKTWSSLEPGLIQGETDATSQCLRVDFA